MNKLTATYIAIATFLLVALPVPTLIAGSAYVYFAYIAPFIREANALAEKEKSK